MRRNLDWNPQRFNDSQAHNHSHLVGRGTAIIAKNYTTKMAGPLMLNSARLLLICVASAVLAAPAAAEFPTPIISECPKGTNGTGVVFVLDLNTAYIRSGTTATCKCSKDPNGPQSGHVVWVDDKGNRTNVQQTESKDNSSSVLTIYGADVNNKTFLCVGLNSQMEQDTRPNISKRYTAQFAYGPSSVMLLEASDVNVCPKYAKQANGLECRTPESGVHPSSKLDFRLFVDTKVEIQINQYPVLSQGMYRFLPALRPVTGGIYKVTCRATNTVFGDMFVEDSADIFFRSPPENPPVFEVDGIVYENGTEVLIREGDKTKVVCRVNGGKPEVNETSVTCGSMTRAASGNMADVEISLDKNKTGQACTCSATHVTGCYDEIAMIHIGVTYQAQITKFTANDEEKELTVNEGDLVNFLCTSDGYPTPTISIEREDRQSNFRTTMKTDHLNMEQILGCRDTDVYYCVAKNDVDDTALGSQRNLQVYVNCPPQLKDSAAQGQVIKAKLKTKVTVDVEFLAHPVPTIDTGLFKDEETFSKELNNDQYRISFMPLTAPYGKLHIEVYVASEKSYGVYRVQLKNTLDNSVFEYRFEIVKEQEDDGPDILPIAVGAGVGALVLIAIVVIVVVVVVRKRSAGRGSGSSLGGFNVTDAAGHHRRPNGGSVTSEPYSGLYPIDKNVHPYNVGFNNGSYSRSDGSSESDYVVPDEYDYIPADAVYTAPREEEFDEIGSVTSGMTNRTRR